MTQVKMNSQVIGDEDVAPLAEELKATVTETFDEARERRASSAVSAKQIRKNAIDFIKKRTAVRKAKLGMNQEKKEIKKDEEGGKE
jgi:hypothetical protein